MYWQYNDGPKALEPHIQIHREVPAETQPEDVSKWFAARIANAFGFRELRCYNRQESPAAGPAGALPKNRVDIW
jgi:hypothetical protein